MFIIEIVEVKIMDSYNILLLIIGIVALVYGILNLYGRNKTVNERKRREKICTIKTTGRIVDVAKDEKYSKKGSVKFSFIYEYEVNGRIHTENSFYEFSGFKSDVADQIINKMTRKEVEIYYNPNKIDEIYVPFEPDGSSLATTKKWVGIIFIVIGLVFLLRFILEL